MSTPTIAQRFIAHLGGIDAAVAETEINRTTIIGWDAGGRVNDFAEKLMLLYMRKPQQVQLPREITLAEALRVIGAALR